MIPCYCNRVSNFTTMQNQNNPSDLVTLVDSKDMKSHIINHHYTNCTFNYYDYPRPSTSCNAMLSNKPSSPTTECFINCDEESSEDNCDNRDSCDEESSEDNCDNRDSCDEESSEDDCDAADSDCDEESSEETDVTANNDNLRDLVEDPPVCLAIKPVDVCCSGGSSSGCNSIIPQPFTGSIPPLLLDGSKEGIIAFIKKFHADNPSFDKKCCMFCGKRHDDLEYVSNMTRHLGFKHMAPDAPEDYKCDTCDHTYDSFPKLDRHKQYHKKLKCKLCGHVAKTKEELSTHMSDSHKTKLGDQAVCWLCDPITAFDTAKMRDNHIKNVHDIGPNKCDECNGMCHFHLKWTDPSNGLVKYLCKRCERKLNPKISKSESVTRAVVMSMEELGPYYICGANESTKAAGGCGDVKMDMCFAGPISEEGSLALDVESDGYQHLKYDYSNAEERHLKVRISVGKNATLHTVRFNPDRYNTPDGSRQKTLKQRHEILKRVIRLILTLPLKLNELREKTWYLFYNQDNPTILKNRPHELIYE
jgi:hypothetical protein